MADRLDSIEYAEKVIGQMGEQVLKRVVTPCVKHGKLNEGWNMKWIDRTDKWSGG